MTDELDAPRCTLPQVDLNVRLLEWREVLAHATQRSQAPGVLTAELPDTPEIRASLDALIEAESHCCTSLTFTTTETPTGLRLTLNHPPGFTPWDTPAARSLFP